jgi:hypothetical protein
MTKRLGTFLYWTACFIAVVAVCLAVYATTEGTAQSWYTVGILAGGGILIWLCAYALRHTLTGR